MESLLNRSKGSPQLLDFAAVDLINSLNLHLLNSGVCRRLAVVFADGVRVGVTLHIIIALNAISEKAY